MTTDTRATPSPGPWDSSVTDDGYLVVTFGARCEASCPEVTLGDMECVEGEDFANARLIAAAPALMAAVDAYLAIVDALETFVLTGEGADLRQTRSALTDAVAAMRTARDTARNGGGEQ